MRIQNIIVAGMLLALLPTHGALAQRDSAATVSHPDDLTARLPDTRLYVELVDGCGTCRRTMSGGLAYDRTAVDRALASSQSPYRGAHTIIGSLLGAALGGTIGYAIEKHSLRDCERDPSCIAPLGEAYATFDGGAIGLVVGGAVGWYWTARDN